MKFIKKLLNKKIRVFGRVETIGFSLLNHFITCLILFLFFALFFFVASAEAEEVFVEDFDDVSALSHTDILQQIALYHWGIESSGGYSGKWLKGYRGGVGGGSGVQGGAIAFDISGAESGDIFSFWTKFDPDYKVMFNSGTGYSDPFDQVFPDSSYFRIFMVSGSLESAWYKDRQSNYYSFSFCPEFTNSMVTRTVDSVLLTHGENTAWEGNSVNIDGGSDSNHNQQPCGIPDVPDSSPYPLGTFTSPDSLSNYPAIPLMEDLPVSEWVQVNIRFQDNFHGDAELSFVINGSSTPFLPFDYFSEGLSISDYNYLVIANSGFLCLTNDCDPLSQIYSDVDLSFDSFGDDSNRSNSDMAMLGLELPAIAKNTIITKHYPSGATAYTPSFFEVSATSTSATTSVFFDFYNSDLDPISQACVEVYDSVGGYLGFVCRDFDTSVNLNRFNVDISVSSHAVYRYVFSLRDPYVNIYDDGPFLVAPNSPAVSGSRPSGWLHSSSVGFLYVGTRDDYDSWRESASMPQSSGFTAPVNSSTTLSQVTLDCGDGFSSGICNIASTLTRFSATSTKLNRTQTDIFINNLKRLPPVSYVYTFLGVFDLLNATGYGVEPVYLELTILGNTYPVLTPETLATVISDDNLVLLHSLIMMCLWVVIGWFIVYKSASLLKSDDGASDNI